MNGCVRIAVATMMAIWIGRPGSAHSDEPEIEYNAFKAAFVDQVGGAVDSEIKAVEAQLACGAGFQAKRVVRLGRRGQGRQRKDDEQDELEPPAHLGLIHDMAILTGTGGEGSMLLLPEEARVGRGVGRVTLRAAHHARVDAQMGRGERRGIHVVALTAKRVLGLGQQRRLGGEVRLVKALPRRL